MGKNPNASRLKVNHRKKDQSDEEDKLAELQEEAAKLGCAVWEIDDVKKKMAGLKVDEESDSDEEVKEEVKPKK